MTGEGRGRRGTPLGQMMKQHPEATLVDRDALVECIERCSTCEAACVTCADACLSEQDVDQLVDCTRRNLGCADLCGATVRLLSRHSSREPACFRTPFFGVHRRLHRVPGGMPALRPIVRRPACASATRP